MRERVERALGTLVILAALATIPLTVAQEQGVTSPIVVVGDWVVWLIFLIEYTVMVSISQDRWGYTRRNWVSVVIVVLSFPALPALLSLVRLARLLRLVRILVVTPRGMRALRLALGRPGLLHVIAATAFLILVGGGLLAMLEPDTTRGGFWDGVWWGIVTATTVGYGDISPVTLWGRLVAVGLMLAGVGLVSTLAASIAAQFLGQEEGVDLKSLEARLERIEHLLSKVVDAPDHEVGPSVHKPSP